MIDASGYFNSFCISIFKHHAGLCKKKILPCVPFVFQSSYPMRMNRCNQILKKAISLKQSLGKFIGDANKLTDKLLELCNKPVHARMHDKQ